MNRLPIMLEHNTGSLPSSCPSKELQNLFFTHNSTMPHYSVPQSFQSIPPCFFVHSKLFNRRFDVAQCSKLQHVVVEFSTSNQARMNVVAPKNICSDGRSMLLPEAVNGTMVPARANIYFVRNFEELGYLCPVRTRTSIRSVRASKLLGNWNSVTPNLRASSSF